MARPTHIGDPTYGRSLVNISVGEDPDVPTGEGPDVPDLGEEGAWEVPFSWTAEDGTEAGTYPPLNSNTTDADGVVYYGSHPLVPTPGFVGSGLSFPDFGTGGSPDFGGDCTGMGVYVMVVGSGVLEIETVRYTADRNVELTLSHGPDPVDDDEVQAGEAGDTFIFNVDTHGGTELIHWVFVIDDGPSCGDKFGFGGATWTPGTESAWVPALAVKDDDDTSFDVVGEDGITAVGDVFLRGTLPLPYILDSILLRLGLENAGSTTVTVEGASDIDFTSPVTIGSLTFTATGSYTAQDITIPISGDGYPYIRFSLGTAQGVRVYEVTLTGPVVPDHTHSGPLTADLDDLTDVVITSPVEGQRLRFDGTSWVNTSLVWKPVLAFDPDSGLYVNVHSGGDPVMAEG